MRQKSIAMTIGGLTAIGTSMASSFMSDPQNLFAVYAFGVQVAWSGGAAPIGTFKLQGSLDPDESNIILKNNAPVNWTDITSSPQTVSGTPGSILYDVTECSYRWVRVVYTASSGSSTVTDAQFNVKGV